MDACDQVIAASGNLHSIMSRSVGSNFNEMMIFSSSHIEFANAAGSGGISSSQSQLSALHVDSAAPDRISPVQAL
jgi:hypothetical protein